MIFLSVLLLNAHFLLVLAQSPPVGERGIDWGPDLGSEEKCDMRLQSDYNKRACASWPEPYPSPRGDPNYMRLFQVVISFKAANFNLRGVEYRCPQYEDYYLNYASAFLGQVTPPASCPKFNCFQNLIAERIVYATAYIFDPRGEVVKKGKFGPLFVRAPTAETRAATVPGFDKWSTNIFNNGQNYYKWFVPYLRRDFTTGDYDPTIKEWGSGKRDYEAAVSVSVICRDQEKNCQPPMTMGYFNRHWFASYSPIVRADRAYDMDPRINSTYLNSTHFHLDLTHWVPSSASQTGLNHYIQTVIQGGYTNYPADNACRHPKVQFVLYDSNPAPHDYCDTDPATPRWDRKNGEIRAVFAQFSVNMAYAFNTVPSPTGSGTVQVNYLVKSWDIQLNGDNWNEDQLKFLQWWQEQQKTPSPDVLDARDTSWYKDWNKTTGMSVAFTFCACRDIGSFTTPIYGCREYVHSLVDIRDRTWLE